MNDNERDARNQLAKVIDDAPFLPTSDARIGDLADLIIAHLWSRFDSEFRKGDNVDALYAKFLTELIGPRPTEQEASDER